MALDCIHYFMCRYQHVRPSETYLRAAFQRGATRRFHKIPERLAAAHSESCCYPCFLKIWWWLIPQAVLTQISDVFTTQKFNKHKQAMYLLWQNSCAKSVTGVKRVTVVGKKSQVPAPISPPIPHSQIFLWERHTSPNSHHPLRKKIQ